MSALIAIAIVVVVALLVLIYALNRFLLRPTSDETARKLYENDLVLDERERGNPPMTARGSTRGWRLGRGGGWYVQRPK